MNQLHAIIHGRVQLVMFRDFVTRKARTLKLTGRVRNMEDGTVRVIAEGAQDLLEQLIVHLKRGPLLAQVTRVDISWLSPSQQYQDFNIDYGKDA